MSKHRFDDTLRHAPLPASGATPFPMLKRGEANSPRMMAYGTTVPSDAAVGYSTGCLFIHTDGSGNTALYINTGTAASATFDRIDEIAGAAGMTVPTGQVFTVVDADALLVGSKIVPQELVLVINLWPHASLKTRNLFYAQTVGYTVTGIVYEPEIAEGTGSVVCTVCKATGNNVAVAATTPMCTAFAVTGTAGTPVVATLTATGADLVLAATNKIGCIFTGGDEFLDSGAGRLYIKMKRS